MATSCRKEATRTPDPYVPNVVRYQLRYFPNAGAKVVQAERKNKKNAIFFGFPEAPPT